MGKNIPYTNGLKVSFANISFAMLWGFDKFIYYVNLIDVVYFEKLQNQIIPPFPQIFAEDQLMLERILGIQLFPTLNRIEFYIVLFFKNYILVKKIYKSHI